jgi:hypothetical protein
LYAGGEDDEEETGGSGAIRADAYNFLLGVIDDNVLLGVPFKLMPSPTVFERSLLLILFVATCVFMTHAEDIMGPICIREYTRQCPDFVVTLNTDPPEVLNMTEATIETQQARRLEEAFFVPSSMDQTPAPSTPAVEAEAILNGERDSIYARYREVLSRTITRPTLARTVSHFHENCSRPMCDLFAPEMVTVNYTHQFEKGRFSVDTPLGLENSTTVVAGVCKCTPNDMYASVLGAEQAGVWRSLVFMLIVTTVVPKVFRSAFQLPHKAVGGGCAQCTAYQFVMLMMLLLLAIVVLELSVCVILGDEITWKHGLNRALLNALFFQPVASIVIPVLWQRCCYCCPDLMHPPWVNPSYTGNYYDSYIDVKETLEGSDESEEAELESRG